MGIISSISSVCALPVGIILFLFLLSGIRVVYQYQRGVKFRLGRYVGLMGPGLRYVIPMIEKMHRVDIRVFTVDITPQECMTMDNVTVKVNAVLYFKVTAAQNAILEIQDFRYAVSQLAQTTLRSIIGKSELDTVLMERQKIGEEIQKVVDVATDPWGIKVTGVEVKDIELPDSMKRAMAKQAEAERDRKAHVIKSLGEVQAAENINKAAKNLAKIEGGLHLRTLQTMSESAPEPNTTIVIPLPIDMLRAFEGEGKK